MSFLNELEQALNQGRFDVVKEGQNRLNRFASELSDWLNTNSAEEDLSELNFTQYYAEEVEKQCLAQVGPNDTDVEEFFFNLNDWQAS